MFLNELFPLFGLIESALLSKGLGVKKKIFSGFNEVFVASIRKNFY